MRCLFHFCWYFVVHVAEEKLECIWKSSLLLFEVRLEEGWVIFALMFIEQISCKKTAILLCFIIPRLNIVDSFATSSKSQEKLCSSKEAEEQCLPVSNPRKKVHARNKQCLRLYLQSIEGTCVWMPVLLVNTGFTVRPSLS